MVPEKDRLVGFTGVHGRGTDLPFTGKSFLKILQAALAYPTQGPVSLNIKSFPYIAANIK